MALPVLSNDSVISLWAEGREARNHQNTLKAIDGDLFSYNLKIGRWARQDPRGYGNAPDGLGHLPAIKRGGAILMGELVNLKEYRALKAEQEAEQEMDEALKNINELEMLKNILEGIVKDLPEIDASIMYVPVEPKMDAFMHKDDFDIAADLDGYLTKLGLKYSEDDE